MEFMILAEPREVLSRVSRIRQLADDHRGEFGFLPFAAYDELALKGQLWIAALPKQEEPLGYIIFGGSGSEAKIFQLYVSPEFRGRGVASALLEKMKGHARANHHQLITARVATDLPANHFWERQGFFVIKQVAGGQTTGRVINIRVCDLPHASLIESDAAPGVDSWIQTPQDEPIFSTPTYALDLNVVLDLARDRIDADLAGRLFSAAFDGEVRVCICPEFLVELKRHSLSSAEDPLLKLAERLPVLPALQSQEVSQLLDQLRALVFPHRAPSGRRAANDSSDLMHLAACIHHRVKGFVTRERAIVAASRALEERFNIEVLSPFDLILPANEKPSVRLYPSIDLGSVSIKTAAFTESCRSRVREFLQKLEVPGAKIAELLEPGTSTRPRSRLLIYENQLLVGYLTWAVSPVSNKSFRYYVLIDEATVGAGPAVDHALGTLLSTMSRERLVQCEVWCSKSQIATRTTAHLMGFTKALVFEDGLVGWSKLAFNGVVTPDNWKEFSAEFLAHTGTSLPDVCPNFQVARSTGILLSRPNLATKRAIDILAFEEALSPLILLGNGRPGVMVPIRDKQASELLPSVEVQASLFRKEAIIRLERAYFSRPSTATLFARGTLAIFYVSGHGGGRGEAVGLARITACGTSSPVQLSLDLLRQGVLGREELMEMASPSGEVGYMTFDRFVPFDRPVPFRRLKKIGCVGGANLVTSQALETSKLLALVREAIGKDLA